MLLILKVALVCWLKFVVVTAPAEVAFLRMLPPRFLLLQIIFLVSLST